MSQFIPLLEKVISRIKAPALFVLGAPRLVPQLAARLDLPDTACYQMDLYQADRLNHELASSGVKAEVRVAPDLWDLPPEFNSVVFPSPPRAERELKIDMVDQAQHVLRPDGSFFALSPIVNDQFFTRLMKKTYGNSTMAGSSDGTVVWSHRETDRPRRRHEITVQARVGENESMRFVTRPGVFTYGQMDMGTRALMTAAEIAPGDRVLDMGCGAGAAGLAAAQKVGSTGFVAFVDSNVRAVALADLNARAEGITNYQAIATAKFEGLERGTFDVILTNPPYYASESIAQQFIEQSKSLLKPGGRLYLVTKQLDVIEPMVAEEFGEPELYESRGYIIILAIKK
jgi:16S rRNA (guanine1207-N2)-methyltransferase